MILHFWQFFLYLADDNDVMSDQYFVPQNKLYQRSPFIPYFDYYPSYIIWVKNYTQLFSIFDSTILQCKQKVDVGIYDPGKYVHTLSSLLRVLFYQTTWSEFFQKVSILEGEQKKSTQTFLSLEANFRPEYLKVLK